jgi:ribonuclease HII
MTLQEFDNVYRERGFSALCGVDEAGRGPLAGPVYAAAVILPPDAELPRLNDSKKLSHKQREALHTLITEQAITYSVATASEAEIDEINIMQAALLAMRRAVNGLAFTPEIVLVDGNQDPHFGLPTELVIGGDGKSAAIAAASILAKVERDRYMAGLDRQYPKYQFAVHKGYPTKLHYELLDRYGPSPLHRESFLRKWRERE